RKLVEQQASQSPALREWLRSGRGGDRETSAGIELLQAASAYLGNEIVIAASADAGGRLTGPVLLAETKKPGLAEFLNARARQAGAQRDLPLLVRNGVAALAPDGAPLGPRLAGGFAGTPLFARLSETYRDGAGLLVAADLERMPKQAGAAASSIRQAILEQKEIGGRTDTQATLYFRDGSTCPAAWLAPPAPIGALDFVSPEATMAAGFVLKNPVLALEELAAMNSRIPPEIRELAPSLGGEFALAFDGAGFPPMTWKIAAEVNDPLRLQAAIERLLAEKKQAVRMRQESFGGRTYYLLSLAEASQFGEAAYTFADGYLIAAASRGLVERALQQRASGFTLTRSTDFIQLAPRGGNANFSGMLYQNMGPTLGPLAEIFAAGAQIKPEQKNAIRQFASHLKPALVTFSGGAESIAIASSSDLLGLNPAKLAGLSGPMALLELFTQKKGTSGK
ncbi:MAG: hypothetical protein HY822_14500, partial [Acidobacteria bacterium]|nr:hypothetical protein [Acidobacteriota bacterium]